MKKLLEVTTSSETSLFVEVDETFQGEAMRGGLDNDRSFFTDKKSWKAHWHR